MKDVIIIGAGPSGIAAALELHRHNIHPLIIEKNSIGGLLRNAHHIRNYPGFPGISGKDFTSHLEKQIKKIGIPILYTQALDITYRHDAFAVQTIEKQFVCKKLIIATGTKPKPFTDCIIPPFCLNRIMYEIFPILCKKNKKIAIIGAGDAACDYAINLSQHNTVYIFNRGENKKCSPLLWKHIEKSDRISYYEYATLLSVIEGKKRKLHIKFNHKQKDITYDVDFLVFAIGREQNLDCMSKVFPKDATKPEKKGLLFFIGDVKNHPIRQTAIAVGDGVKAGMMIGKY